MSRAPHHQIVTLSIAFDLKRCPPPESWSWAEVGAHLNGAAEVKLLAAGDVEVRGEDERPAIDELLNRVDNLTQQLLKLPVETPCPPELEAAMQAVRDFGFDFGFETAVRAADATETLKHSPKGPTA